MSGHSVSAAHDEIITPMVLESASSNGHHRRAPKAFPQKASDSIGSLQLPGTTSPPKPAGNNGNAETTAPTDDAATPSVPARLLGSTGSRSSDVTGSGGRSDSGVGEAAARAVLLATKLHVPAIGAQLVQRTALLDALSAGRSRKLTLLSAPAGWGKTTVLAQWALAVGEDQRFGWLSIDHSDNDPVWFWMYVIAALQKVSPGVGIRAVELLAMARRPSAGCAANPAE